jgi:hypothetical protein
MSEAFAIYPPAFAVRSNKENAMPLREIAAEMTRRASRRKSRWNLLLIPFGIAGIVLSWYGLAQLLLSLRARFFPSDAFLMSGTRMGNIFLYIPLLFPSMCIGILVANFAVWVFPPARRALDDEAHGVAGSDFKSSNLVVAKILVLELALLLPVAALGATSYFYLNSRGITHRAWLLSEERHYPWSDLSAVETACWYSRNSRDLSYALVMQDGRRIEILESGRDFLKAYPTLSSVLKGRSYSFRHDIDPRCDDETLPAALKKALITAPSTVMQKQ